MASQRLTPRPKTADPVYTSREWRALITAIIKQSGRRCEECGRTGTRIYGDHLKELKDGGALLDPNNVLLRCGSCHTRKTNEERAKRMATGKGFVPLGTIWGGNRRGSHRRIPQKTLPSKYLGQEKSNENAAYAVFESAPSRDATAASASVGTGT